MIFICNAWDHTVALMLMLFLLYYRGMYDVVVISYNVTLLLLLLLSLDIYMQTIDTLPIIFACFRFFYPPADGEK